eukprot:330848-Rhodomonas_salina.1
MHIAQLLVFACIAWTLKWPHSPTQALDTPIKGGKFPFLRSSPHQAQHEHEPFDAVQLRRQLGLDVNDCVWMEFSPRDKLYGLALKFVAQKSETRSFAPAKPKRAATRFGAAAEQGNQPHFDGLQFGLGVTCFEHDLGGEMHKVYAVHQVPTLVFLNR